MALVCDVYVAPRGSSPHAMSALASIIKSAKHVFLFRYITVATLCLVFHEYLINLDHEVRYLWSRRFHVGFVLLFLCRYLQIVEIVIVSQGLVWTSDHRSSYCRALIKASTGVVFCQFSLSVVVLTTRTYTVWEGHRKIRTFLVCACLAALISTSYSIYVYNHRSSVPDITIGNGCLYLVDDPYATFLAMVGHVAMDSLNLGLLLIKSVQHAKFMNSYGGASGGTKVSILAVMAQDGVKYFIFNLMCSLTNLIGLRRFPPEIHSLLLSTQACVQNVLCARLHFHLQSVNEGWGMNRTGLGVASSMPMEMGAIGRRHRGAQSDIKFAEISAAATGHSVNESVMEGDIA